jgi:hypothetical protein
MTQILLIGIGSGAASALLFASPLSGSAFSVVLSFLASLPILMAAIGWRHRAGLVGLVTGSLGLAAAVSPWFGFIFLTGVALPAWWLAYLALLARTGPGGPPEWYPIGRLVLWAAVIAAVLVVVSVAMLADDFSDYQAGIRNAVEQWLRAFVRARPDEPLSLPNIPDTDRFIDLMVLLVPPTLALSWALTTLVNLWLAGRIVRRSGHLVRPWPDIAVELAFPRGTAAVVGVAALVGSFVPGLFSLFGEVLATTLLAAFAMLGLAVLHVVTRSMPARSIILIATYAFLFVQGWPFLLFALLGLADQLFGIRLRFLARRRPAAPPLDPT